MKNTFKAFITIATLLLVFSACKKKEYSMGDMTAPSNIVITTEVVGVDATHPNGDGSGNVKISVTADNALAVKLDYDASNSLDLKLVTSSPMIKKYTKLGTNTYLVTAVVIGKGGTSSTATKEVTVFSNFTPEASIVTNLTGDDSKTWVIDPSVPGHFGVGPWDNTSVTPSWWAAAVNEKASCCNCFYTASFTFTKLGSTGNFTLKVTTPDGAFTKTGLLAGGLPGIPADGGEACYPYDGGTSDFSFIPASTGIVVPTSTQTSISLVGVNTFIGYGATLKEYEIMEISPTNLYLRVQGTEVGDAWYMRLIPKP